MSLSLEPAPAVAYDNHDNDVFERPPKLVDVTDDGQQVFSRDDPDKGITARLMRIWQERGDFSKVTAASILASQQGQGLNKDKHGQHDHSDFSGTLSVAQIKDLSTNLVDQLAMARTELATALDLLSVIAPLTDPPTIDVDSLPLAPETLAVVPIRPPSNESTSSADPNINPNAKLSLATSLASIKASAASFFKASDVLLPSPAPPQSPASSDDIDTRMKDANDDFRSRESVWPTLLHLRTTTSFLIVPLGASDGASLTGKGEQRLAKQVGINFACQEAGERFRRAGVARIRELVNIHNGQQQPDSARRMTLTIEMAGEIDQAVWHYRSSTGNRSIEDILTNRRQAAFAEELFALLSDEIRNDVSSKAKLVMARRGQGDSIMLEGHDWKMTLSMASSFTDPSTATSTARHQSAAIVLPLLRLLLLQEYAARRRQAAATTSLTSQSTTATSPRSRPILQTLSAFLTHRQRLAALVSIIELERDRLVAAGLTDASSEYWGACAASRRRSRHDVLSRDAGESVERVLRSDTDLGGRIVLRATEAIVFHISFSTLLPHLVAPQTIAPSASHQPLNLLAPKFALGGVGGGGGASGQASSATGVPVASVKQLQSFMAEHVAKVIANKQGGSADT
ncbi:hypothetical protein OIO90_005248 [Microbotryomycetes sp. JL221]|nr:hypothetical protein OIO90_005248 [Microbotryomycetes sp. JL221]